MSNISDVKKMYVAKVDLDVALLQWIYLYVAGVCFKCFSCFKRTL
jgi:hypothetical protein